MIRSGILFGLVLLTPCGCVRTPSATVTGRITCQNTPVKGTVMFSPFGEGEDNTGVAVTTDLKEDGSYEVQLKTIGKHRIVVSPSDIVYPAKPGEEYPCVLTPIEKEITSGNNEIVIQLGQRPK